MADNFDFSVHGVSVIPEFTKEFTGSDNGLFLRRTGYGAEIRQRASTSNWFHFAVPSATFLDGNRVELRSAWLSYTINAGAVIERINIHQRQSGEGGPEQSPRIFFSSPLTLTDTSDFWFTGSLEGLPSLGPIAISVFVRFEEDDGTVTFIGAGVNFSET